MSVPADTVLTYAETTIREDLQDLVYDVSPTETPFISAIGQETASATFKEWPQDKLRAAADNSKVEGSDVAAEAQDPRLRPGNYLNLSDQGVFVSDEMRSVDAAGVNDELPYQTVRAGLELRRDMEKMSTGPQAANAGSSTTARVAAGAEAWIKTNLTHGATGSTPDWAASGPYYPQAAPTDGTLRALNNADWKQLLQDIWNAGGDPAMAIAGGSVRQRMSELTGVATLRTETNGEQGTIVGAADIYVSDFSPSGIRLVADRFCRQNVALVIDPDYWALAYLQRMEEIDLAKTGHAEKRVVRCSWTLMAKNEESSGKFADIDGAAAVT